MKLSLTLLACSVCFGEPGSLASKSVIVAVLFMGGVTVSVLSAIAFFALTWARRAKSIPEIK